MGSRMKLVARDPVSSRTLESTTRHDMSGLGQGNPPDSIPALANSVKTTPESWQESNFNRKNLAVRTHEFGKQLRTNTRQLEKEVKVATQKKQADNTQKIAERARDVEYWKYELGRMVGDMKEEIVLLAQHKNRLDNSLHATEIPMNIATDSVRLRERRVLPDMVADKVEHSLNKEVDLIKKAQSLLINTIEEANKQQNQNRMIKQALEADWSDKQEAHWLNTFAASLSNKHPDITYSPGSVAFPAGQTTPEDWTKLTSENIARAEQERQSSEDLRKVICNVLNDVSNDMQQMSSEVETELNRRVEEIEDEKNQHQDQLIANIGETQHMEKGVTDLKTTVRSLEAPMKVAHMRLSQHHQRPSADNVRDNPHFGLVQEVEEIGGAARNVGRQLDESENTLKSLRDMRLDLDRSMAAKANSLFIDREKCLAMRPRYSQPHKIMGFK